MSGQRMRSDRWYRAGALAAVTSASLVGAAACGSVSMPSVEGLGRIGQAALPIGPEKEREIGFGIAATMAGRYPIVNDAALNEYVSLVGATVAEQSIRGSEVEFHFAVLDTDDVNAFAAPGGYIFVTRGALALMTSESELAGVLAHEVAHVDEKHVLDGIRQAGTMQAASDEAQLSGPLLDAISGKGASLLLSGLSREDEMEADSLGMLYAAAVGYRPDGMIRFLEHVSSAVEQQEGGLAAFASSHAATADRLDAIRRQIAAAGLTESSGAANEARFRGQVRR